MFGKIYNSPYHLFFFVFIYHFDYLFAQKSLYIDIFVYVVQIHIYIYIDILIPNSQPKQIVKIVMHLEYVGRTKIDQINKTKCLV